VVEEVLFQLVQSVGQKILILLGLEMTHLGIFFGVENVEKSMMIN